MRFSSVHRSRLILNGVVGLVLVTLVACSAASTPTTAPSATSPSVPTLTATPQVTRLKVAAVPPSHESLNPSEITRGSLWQVAPMYEGLLELAPQGEIVPMLATGYEVSEDAMTWTIQLRQGVQWHGNKGEFTANDLVHSLNVLTREETISAAGTFWRELLELPGETDRIEVVNDHEIRLRLTKPTPNLTSQLNTTWNLLMLSKAQFDAEGFDGMANQPAGTGPYMLSDRQIGRHLLYQRVEGTHWRVTPDFEELQLLFAPEEGTRLAMLLAGEVDITMLSPDSTRQAVAAGMEVVHSTLPTSDLILVFGGNYLPTAPQYNSEIPWTKREVREAMNHAINRQELRNELFDGNGDFVMVPRMHPTLQGWNPQWPERFENMYGYDPARGKTLLDEAGYTRGFNVDLLVPPRTDLPQIVQVGEAIGGYWREIGLDVQVHTQDWSLIREKSRNAELYDPFLITVPFDFTPEDILSAVYWSKNPNYWYNGETLDQLFQQLSESIDHDERGQLLTRIGDYLFEEYATVPLLSTTSSFTINPKVVAEYVTTGLPQPPRDLEYVKAAQ